MDSAPSHKKVPKLQPSLTDTGCRFTSPQTSRRRSCCGQAASRRRKRSQRQSRLRCLTLQRTRSG
ncbi:growth and transformation-dependent protein, isoform CRA_b [Rattus norvegicus]|uniref:Growth and transformation-dependent protein, isoform CRA_b n=1 Tax=Rattus norvegicus TaxID=10116 RepID=A6IRE3_RAT|nr:growth and transformation-dependent protein, isoform CRA_b [Rattus norvegicus]